MSSCDRMTPEQVAQLALAICATAEVLGHTLSAEAAQLMAEDLADYSRDAVRAALKSCRRELTGKLTLAAILQRVQAEDGRPGDDEAWALALRASDESDSVVLTEEILLALSAARPVLAAGDKIGARMAFKGAYLRTVDAARREGRAARWLLTMGHDPQRRLLAVYEAARQGRLPALQVAEYVVQLTHEQITDDGRAIAGLLTGNVVAMPSAEHRERWLALRAEIERKGAETKTRLDAEREAERADLERRKAQALAALEGLEKRAGGPAHG